MTKVNSAIMSSYTILNN